jgi:hypothetical protein
MYKYLGFNIMLASEHEIDATQWFADVCKPNGGIAASFAAYTYASALAKAKRWAMANYKPLNVNVFRGEIRAEMAQSENFAEMHFARQSAMEMLDLQ